MGLMNSAEGRGMNPMQELQSGLLRVARSSPRTPRSLLCSNGRPQGFWGEGMGRGIEFGDLGPKILIYIPVPTSTPTSTLDVGPRRRDTGNSFDFDLYVFTPLRLHPM